MTDFYFPAGARGRSSFATPEINSPSSPYPECFIDATEFFVDSGNKRDVATMTDCLSLASPFKGQRTPVPVLRERVHSLRQTLEEKEKENEDLKGELNDLCSFTRLEQEIGVHFNQPNKVAAADVISITTIHNLSSWLMLHSKDRRTKIEIEWNRNLPNYCD